MIRVGFEPVTHEVLGRRYVLVVEIDPYVVVGIERLILPNAT
ncbi:MAG: hypothetical protein R3B13_37405 [Polyangiaceae bacterium]